MDNLDYVDEILGVFDEVVDVAVHVEKQMIKRKSFIKKVWKFTCSFRFTCCSKSAETHTNDQILDIR